MIAAGCAAPLHQSADGNYELIQFLIKEELKVKLQNFPTISRDMQPNGGGEEAILVRGLVNYSHLQDERIQHIKGPGKK
ncbi:MAG: hypothetical protein PVG01_02190 [Desulfobacterales bacterium]